MIKRAEKNCVLLYCKENEMDSYESKAIERLRSLLESENLSVLQVDTLTHFNNTAASALRCKAVLLNLNQKYSSSEEIFGNISRIKELHPKFPVFLFDPTGNASRVSADYLKMIDGFISPFEDTDRAICGRILSAIDDYESHLLPPMYKALKEFSHKWKFSWHTPGHSGGTAFLKHPASSDFYDFFGENLFRSDISISVGEVGSLLDHTGPIGQSENYISKVFGSSRSYSVTNGSSTANRVVFMASVAKNQITLCDRNCHKSIEQSLSMTGAVPYYLIPTQNYLGIIGPVLPETLKSQTLKKGISEHPFASELEEQDPVYAIITNSTYDGLCYNTATVEKLLGETVDRLHFDEAWYGYARFNPLYKDRFAMRDDADKQSDDNMTVFCTQSTHKLLAALSQASLIHVRDGKNPIDHDRFNETFMMHASTSPNYAILASNDIAASMMDGDSGRKLTDEALKEAITCRRTLAEIYNDFKIKNDWFFNCWQPDVIHTSNNDVIPLYAADLETLSTDSNCWVLHPNEEWHGYGDIQDGYCMLDPTRVSIVTPGISPSGFDSWGIPACVLSSYLYEKGVVAEKSTDFTLLFLFSIGITKGKWSKLLEILLKFKKDYDENIALDLCMPKFYNEHSADYAQMGLKDLCQHVFLEMKKQNTTQLIPKAFTTLPRIDMLPADAYDKLVRNDIEMVPLKEAEGKTLATGIVPYPPGIPLLMPGENIGSMNEPYMKYMTALEAFDRNCPGFEHDTHGVISKNGDYYISIIK